jgi:hypothetical protein
VQSLTPLHSRMSNVPPDTSRRLADGCIRHVIRLLVLTKMTTAAPAPQSAKRYRKATAVVVVLVLETTRLPAIRRL